MKKLFVSILLLAASYGAFACTNFLVGKNASVDGSTIISYAADSYSLYGFLAYQPAADHQPGDMRKIYDWDTGKYLGEIPEVAHTYSVVGNMNEYQLTIGETTWGGREEQMDTLGGIDYGSLIYVALQRCKTAREAIKCMTDLVAEYGYFSEGESFSIGDPNEIWILEMIGKGVGNKGAVWVATRIPDDCVSAHANFARITQINFKDKDNWMYSEDVIDYAREKGYYTGSDKDFSFSDTYNALDFSGIYACEARVWSFFRRVNPDMDKYFDYASGKQYLESGKKIAGERMPLYIKPAQKLSAQDIKNLMRDQYQGTDLDITQGTAAGPWHSKLRYGGLSFTLDSVVYWYPRPTATQQTGWSFVAQMRGYMPEHVGGIFWFGVDDAASTVYVPIYSRCNRIPWCYDERNGDFYNYSATSAFWTFNKVANMAYGKYDAMMQDIVAAQVEWESYFNTLVESIDKNAADMNTTDAQNYLTTFCGKQAEAVVVSWNKLWEYLLVKYIDGQQKKEQNGQFIRNAYGNPVGPNRIPYPEEFLRTIAPEVVHE